MRVAFIHGFVGAPDVWSDVPVPKLEARYVTLPGHGIDSVRPTWQDNLALVAQQVGSVDCVVGYSLGARVALGLVANRKAPRAILVSVNPGLDDDQREPRRIGDAAWAAMLRERGLEHFLAAWETQPLFASQARVDEKRKALRRARRMSLVPEQLARSLEVMGLAEMPDYRGAIDGRIALVTGADDHKYTAIAMGYGVKHEVIANAGHDPMFEQPVALAAAIGRLL